MSKKIFGSFLTLAAIVGSSFIILPFTASEAYACNDFWGKLDPTCPGRPLGPLNSGGSSESCLAVMSSSNYELTIENSTDNSVAYKINNQSFKLDPGYERQHSYPASRGSSGCDIQSYKKPVISFDSSYDPGVQSASYDIGNISGKTRYRFKKYGNGVDIFKIQ